MTDEVYPSTLLPASCARAFQDLGIDTVAYKLRAHAEKENSWQSQDLYDLPEDK